MKFRLKPLREQVMVITGATSGIGLSTTRMAARNGVRLLIAARNPDALRRLSEEIRVQGGEAVDVEADVGRPEDVRRIADVAVQHFGGFDTWVNNAGASVYGRCLDVDIQDMKRVFDTNFWGIVHGSRVACEHLRRRGGALINVGSEVSDKAVPLQGIYSASKHGVKGWTDALRMELEVDEIPISVTLIKPAAIDTPYPQHAKNYLEDEPQQTPPVYAPEAVAEAILYAAVNPVRDLFVGGGGKLISSMAQFAPSLADKVVEKSVASGTHSGRPKRNREALHHPGDSSLRERGDYPGIVQTTSLYTKAAMHPVLTGVAAVGAGLALAAVLRNRGTNGGQTHP